MRSYWPEGGGWVALGCVATFATMALISSLPQSNQRALMAEGGVVETLSVIGYLICIGLMLVLWPGRS